MDSHRNVDECQLWLNEDDAPAPFIATGKQRKKRSVAVCSMNMGALVPAKGSMTDYRIPCKTTFPPPNQARFLFPSPTVGRLKVPVNLNEGGKKSIGTGVFIPTGRRPRHVASASFKNNQAYIAKNNAPQPQIEKKNVEEDIMEEDIVLEDIVLEDIVQEDIILEDIVLEDDVLEDIVQEDVDDIPYELLLPAEWVY